MPINIYQFSRILYTVMLFLNLSCTEKNDDIACQTDLPQAGFNFRINGASITLFDTSKNAVSYYWDMGDGSELFGVNPSHTYQNSGTYRIKLVAANKCNKKDSAYATAYIVVPESPSLKVELLGQNQDTIRWEVQPKDLKITRQSTYIQIQGSNTLLNTSITLIMNNTVSDLRGVYDVKNTTAKGFIGVYRDAQSNNFVASNSNPNASGSLFVSQWVGTSLRGTFNFVGYIPNTNQKIQVIGKNFFIRF